MIDVPFLCDYKRACTITDTLPYNEIARFCKTNRMYENRAFETLSYFDGAFFAKRSKVKALFSVGLMDILCPPSTVFAAYNNYVQNMTPQQHMIALENDPNVQQVVVWNKSTGAKSFEIMNMATGEILQNVDKHDIMFMEDTTIDERNHTARNIKLNESYPLVVIGESAIDEY